MSSGEQLVDLVERHGGAVWAEGEKLRCRLHKRDAHLVEELRALKPEIIAMLQSRQRPHFPQCPQCKSYALYRRNNTGNYECLTCDRRGITEAMARKIQ